MVAICNVFISYRRADTQDLGGRIADRLKSVPAVKEVFLDVTGIAPGADYAERIETALRRKPVCLVLIGRAWRGARGEGEGARILDENDVVRAEIAHMLADGLRILPVLAGGATMPTPSELPEELRPLSNLNAIPIRHESFDRDLDALFEAIVPGAGGPPRRRRGVRATLLRGLAGLSLAAVVLIGAAALHNAVLGRSLDETLGGTGQVWLLIILVLAAGTGSGLFLRRR